MIIIARWSTSIVGEIRSNSFADSPIPDTLDSISLVDSLAASSSEVRKKAEQSFALMLRWAAHMNIPAVILPQLTQRRNDSSSTLSSYARLLASLAAEASASNVQLWLRVPFDPQALTAFDTLYHNADMPANLGCLICFTNNNNNNTNTAECDATSTASAMTTLHKFIGCNTRAISLDTSVFLTNKRGYPTLSKAHQILFTTFMKRLGKTLRVLVEGGQRHFPVVAEHISSLSRSSDDALSPNGLTGCLTYVQYLRHLRARPEVVAILDSPEAVMETAYLDQLQSPLQPLADDLEFCTYETFEKDNAKYLGYQRAIQQCLQDKLLHGQLDVLQHGEAISKSQHSQGLMMFQDRFPYTHSVSILVVGAGRGPLVRAALLAVEAVNLVSIQQQSSSMQQQPPILVFPRLIALEKNLNAVLFLRSLRTHGGPMWETMDITIVHADVRNIHPSMAQTMCTDSGVPLYQAVDIMVSELLGSFSDNELSPECLQAAIQTGFLKSKTGVCIPQSYQSFVAPVSSMRLHAEARAQAYTPTKSTDGPGGQPFGMLRAMETPYVVRPYAASQMCTEKPCFEFRHVSDLSPPTGFNSSSTSPSLVDNDQFATLEFRIDPASVGSGCGYGPLDVAISSISKESSSSETVVPTNFRTGVTIHGILGTFEAILYHNTNSNNKEPVVLSTAPASFSNGMFSWFPLYFPFKEPIHVPYEATLRLNLWRRSDSSRVWYEWLLEVVLLPGRAEVLLSTSGIHNPNGRSYFVSL